MHYNPFAYIHSEKDILKLVNTLICNTKGDGKSGDDFWVKAETLLYCALIGYIHYEAPEEEQNFATLIELVNAMEVREDDETFENPVDIAFKELEKDKPNHFAVRQYKKYKLAAGKTAKSINISCGARLAPFDIAELREITMYDELELDTLGDKISSVSGGSKNAGSSAQTPASSEAPAPTTEPITKEDGTGFTQNGNSVTRDLLYDKYSNKQFITIETRNGETFYLVIDYDKPLDEDGERYETYFLNLVDEADLLALVEGDKQTPVCSCTTKCEAGAVNTSCEVCKTNMTECTGKEKVVEKVPDTTPEPEVEPEPEKKSNGGAVALLLLLVLGGGGALYWFKLRKKKPDAKGPVDLDDYDYGEEDDGEEYETEPDEGESADAAQDEE